jgi:hypothetical protein
MRKPAGIFDDEGPDISGFALKTESPAPKPEIRAAAEAQNFQSREPTRKPPKKADRRYRTGRNIPLSTKISERCNELLYGTYDSHKDQNGNPKWTIGQIIELGQEALRRELDKTDPQE